MRQRLALTLLFLYASLIQLVSTESDCRSGYFESHPGYKLQGHVITRMASESIWSCVLECRKHLMCFSLNVHTDRNARVECELNKSTKKASPKDYFRVSASGQEHLDLKPHNKDHWMNQPLPCSSDREALPSGWYRHKSFVYKYFNEKLNNQLARQRCLNLPIRADLVSLENEMEKEFVQSLIYVESTTNASTPADERMTWIGLNDKAREGTFEWYDGRPFIYENWAKDEPNNLNSNEDCAISFSDGTWNDVPCDHIYQFVCKALDVI